MNYCAITTGSKNAATILPRAEIPKGVERVNLFPGEGALDVGGLFHGSTVSPVFRRAAAAASKVASNFSCLGIVRWSLNDSLDSGR